MRPERGWRHSFSPTSGSYDPSKRQKSDWELSSRIMDHRGRVHRLLRGEPLRHPEVVLLILVGLAADRPLESNFFPGLLEGLVGSLGIAASGESNPPTSSREGARCAWSTAVHREFSRIEQKEVEAPGDVGLLPGLDLHYEEDSLRNDDIRNHQFSRTCSSSLIWLRRCSRWSSPRWC